jgi:membrane protein required for beta-lactamase induction
LWRWLWTNLIVSKLLLQSSGGETPLVHAIRIGHKDVAIVLLGAFSRWINHLEDEDIQKPQTQTLLKALRAFFAFIFSIFSLTSYAGVGLKLAINEGLAKSQSDLIASFMQTLIMSEGDKWVYAQVSTVARALNSGLKGKPVQVASEAVRKFTTKELGKAALIASLED